MISEDSSCSKLGMEIMSRGEGNSVDAFISTTLCLAVTRPDVASKYTYYL